MSERGDVANGGGYAMHFCGVIGALEAVTRRVYRGGERSAGEGRYDINTCDTQVKRWRG